MKNWADNVLAGVPVAGPEQVSWVLGFLTDHDFGPETCRAFAHDLRKFGEWFVSANREPFDARRVTTRDLVDFREHLRRDRGQAVSTVNRALVALRRYLGWLSKQGHVAANPAEGVKELRRQPLAPKGLDRSQVRRLLREVELRQDVRANAVFSLML